MIDPKQGPLSLPNTIVAEIDAIQLKAGLTRAAIFAAISRVGHDRKSVLAELRRSERRV
jgi:hypothetical protein